MTIKNNDYLLQVASLLLAALFVLPSSSVAADACQVAAPPGAFGGRLPLYRGMAVVTHDSALYSSATGPDGSTAGPDSFDTFTVSSVPTGYVLSVVDIRDPGNSSTESPSIAPIGNNWNQVGLNRYVHSSWTQENMGEVFGIALEEGAEKPDIFVAANGQSTEFSRTNHLPKSGGTGGEVFRINGATGAVTVMKTLPSSTFQNDFFKTLGWGDTVSSFTGLGQLSYNKHAEVVYVPSLDNGKLYTLDASGADSATNVSIIGTPFDHGLTRSPIVADDPSYRLTAYNRMVFGVGYNAADKRLYYSVPVSATIPSPSWGANGGIANQIWSVPTLASGAIDSSVAPVLELTLPSSTNEMKMITDIAFSADNTKMLVAENPLMWLDEGATSLLVKSAHTAFVKGFHGASGGWVAHQTYHVGAYDQKTNARGGVDFGYNNHGVNTNMTNLDDAIVVTGDALEAGDYVLGADLNVYGLQISKYGVAPVVGTSGNTFLARTSVIGSGNTQGRNEKYAYGDVEVFGCPVTVKIGNLIWLEDDNDGDATTGTITYPPAGTVVTATSSGGTQYTGTTDANGNYSIEVFQDDAYTVTVATPAGYQPTKGSGDNNVSDTTSENNRTHDGSGTTVTVGGEDNLTLDFGFTLPCKINSPVVTTACSDNGTAANPADDTFSYSINTTGITVGDFYSLSGGDTRTGVVYGGTDGPFGNFPISGGDLDLTLTDAADATCKLANVVVTAPDTCSKSTDMSLTKEISTSVAKRGDQVVYTLTVTNQSVVTATGVVVTEYLPATLGYVSHNTEETYNDGIWQVGTVPGGESRVLNITVLVK